MSSRSACKARAGSVDLTKEPKLPRSCTASARPPRTIRAQVLLAPAGGRGVRFIQLYSGTNIGEDWDDATTTANSPPDVQKTDQPITAADGPQGAGMLDSTLVVWNSEFGRTPWPRTRPRPPSVCVQHVDGGTGIKGGRCWDRATISDCGLRNRRLTFTCDATILRLIGLDHTG